MARQLWHKWNGESEYFYNLFRIWLELPYDPECPHKRSVREAYARHLGHPLGPGSSAPKEVFKAKRDFDWEGRAAAFDEHLQVKVQEGQDRAVIRGAEKATTMERVINANRMALDVANLIDELSPDVVDGLKAKLQDVENISPQAVAQIARLWLDAVKFVRDVSGDGDDDEGYTEEELEALLGEKHLPQDDPEDNRQPEEDLEG